jgi:hypothetical protein
MLLSLCAGIATHLVWDTFTHSGHLAILDARITGGLFLHQILQHGSTLLGTVFLAVWLGRKLRATLPVTDAHVLHDRLRLAVVAVMVGLPAAAFLGVLYLVGAHADRLALRAAGVTAFSAFALVTLVYSVGWKLAR